MREREQTGLQINANQSPNGRRAQSTPLGESGGAVQFEMGSGGKIVFLIEVIGD